ncbi:Adhesion G protein-coupled receptor L3 [Hypsibius exemplaris]|uniref:Adhesion G protein-coupled receptor L3 n=1 Tax=Hypsibius exemplaris TaxID=2072580 RepID=A0A1W0WEY0_HYPEX|nr:Adhesion G protein-coupled receptor L3 [Hypsibius exemplaris]
MPTAAWTGTALKISRETEQHVNQQSLLLPPPPLHRLCRPRVTLDQRSTHRQRAAMPFRRSYACEGQTLKINCESPGEPNQRIRVVRANYGRYSISICNPNGEAGGWSTKCMAHTSLQVLTESCSDKASCAVEVADKTFGDDPCPETDKYLEVHYECTSEAVTTTTTPEPVRTVPTTTVSPTFASRVFAVTTAQTTRQPTTRQPYTTISSTMTSSSTPASTSTSAVKSTEPEAGISPAKPQPRVDPSAVVTGSGGQSSEFCAPVLRHNIMWSRTPKGATAFEMCPNEAKGYAEWSCDNSSPPQWNGAPDLSQCTSPWMEEIRRSLAADQPAAKVAEQFASGTARNTLNSGGDMSSAVDVIATLIGRGDRLMAVGRMTDGSDTNPAVQKLGESVLRAGSNLLEPKHDSSWADLANQTRAETATSLIQSMEQTAFMLADNVPIGTILTSSDHNIITAAGRLQTKQLAENYKLPPDSSDNSGGALKNSIELPAVTLKEHSRDNEVKVVFLTYRNIGQYLGSVGDRKVDGGIKGYTVNSKVVTASLNGAKERNVSLREPVIITLLHLERKNGRDSVCAYWDFGNGKDRQFGGQWSTRGCWVVSSDEARTVCACSHLTNFAVLMDVTGTIAQSGHDDPLTKITWIGCSVSIVCLMMTLIIFCSFRSLQSERTTIHKNLAFCLLIAEIFFLAGINQTHLPVGCHVFSALMHYFFLAAFMWSLFEGINLWLMLVDVFEPERSRRTYYYLAGYGVPLLIVAICLGIDWTSYATPDYCWLRADNLFILAFAVPVGLIVAANVFFLSVAMYYMCRNVGLQSALHARDVNTWKHLKTWITGAFALVFVMGITWSFGFAYVGTPETVIFAYFFTFLNAFQGVFIFVLICMRNDKVKCALRQFVASQAQRLSDSICGRSPSTYSDGTPSGGGPGFYQCAPHPLDKEQQYMANNYPTYWHATGRPDMSRRSTVTSTLPPHSPAPVPQCTCEQHGHNHSDYLPTEKGSSRSSNRDSGHESASCPSAESPPMQSVNSHAHLHQRTLYPPSVARKHASQVLQVEYPATAARLAARNARYLYGDRPLYCGDEHIYAEIEQQQLEEEAGQCPYSDPSDESNTSVTYQRTGSDGSTDMEERCPRLVGISIDEDGRKVPVYHPSICSLGSEHKPLISSLGRMDGHQRHCEVRSAFRALSHNTNPHGKFARQGFVIHNTLAENPPYVNGAGTLPLDGGNYNAFGLTGRRDGSKVMVRRIAMPKTINCEQGQGQLPAAFSEC